jgi:hypothetical protein
MHALGRAARRDIQALGTECLAHRLDDRDESVLEATALILRGDREEREVCAGAIEREHGCTSETAARRIEHEDVTPRDSYEGGRIHIASHQSPDRRNILSAAASDRWLATHATRQVHDGCPIAPGWFVGAHEWHVRAPITL